MCSHPVGLDVTYFIEPFVSCHTSCVWTAKALARLRRCAGSPEPSLVTYVISTMSWLKYFWTNISTVYRCCKKKLPKLGSCRKRIIATIFFQVQSFVWPPRPVGSKGMFPKENYKPNTAVWSFLACYGQFYHTLNITRLFTLKSTAAVAKLHQSHPNLCRWKTL